MSKLSILHDALLLAHQGQKSGKLFVYCKSSTGLFGRPGELDLRDGDLIAGRFNQQAGRTAINELIAQNIERVMFMQTGTIPSNQDADTPMMAELLSLVEKALTPSQSVPFSTPADQQFFEELLLKQQSPHRPDWANGLVHDAVQVLTQVHGKNATAKVEDIAAKYPVERDPVEFLHHCQNEAVLTLGKPIARNLFDPIFTKAHSIN